MKNLELIAEELFNKIRGRFPSITIGDEEGKVTDQPKTARFFDFQYKQGNKSLGSVSVTLTDDAVQVMYNTDFVANEDTLTRNEWYNFLKELRMFAKKRLLNFDTRNINKSNLDKRDYQFLAKQRSGDEQMNEAKLYGTSRKSYQDIGTARVTIEHTKPVNHELAAGRTQYIGSLFIESSEGERFKYPFKHLNGARAMARHVSEGGKPHDDFGKYITSLSEELSSLRKFKTYMSRSAVMAEGLSMYNEAVIERIDTIKSTVEKLQRSANYKEAIDNHESAILEDVPTDVAENWIDQLTIRQFNEELQDVFPYIYKLISEKTKAQELGPDDLAEERTDEAVPMILGLLGLAGAGYVASKIMPTAKDSPLGRAIKIACNEGDSDACKYYKNLDAYVDANDTETLEMLVFQYVKEQFGDFDKVPMEDVHDEEIENAFDDLMGQFSERDSELEEGYMKGYQNYHCKDCGCQMHVATPKCDCPHDCHDESGSWWRDKNGNGVPDIVEGKGEKRQAPISEFILSHYDRHTGQFPKGETAVLTAIEKDYGEQFIEPAKQFIEAVNMKFAEINGYKDPDLIEKDKFRKNKQQASITGNPKLDPKIRREIARGSDPKNIRKMYGLNVKEYSNMMRYLETQKMKKAFGEKETFESQMQEALKAGDEEMLMNLYNQYKDNKMIPKKYRDLMGRVKDELKKPKEKRFAALTKGPDDGTRGGQEPNKEPKTKGPDDGSRKGQEPNRPPKSDSSSADNQKQADKAMGRAMPQAPVRSMPKPSDGDDLDFDYDYSGSEVTGKNMYQSTAYDPDYNGPEGYLNDADAIEGLMSSGALSSEEDQWLNMAYVKYNITRENLGKVLRQIRQRVAKKAAADVKNFDMTQRASRESTELEDIKRMAGI